MRAELVIIGAGVAGLTAGCYAARCGYRTTILEMAPTPGGLCTSWTRKGYLFDGSVAGLAGSAPPAPIYRLWQDIGIVDYCELFDPVNFGMVRCSDGRIITIHTNIDELGEHLLDQFPREGRVTRQFIAALRRCRRVEIPFHQGGRDAAMHTLIGSVARLLPALPTLVGYGAKTVREVVNRISDPICADVYRSLVHFGGLDVPLLTVLLPLAYAHRRMTGIPRKGWLGFARAIERRYLEHGGEIHYQSRVTGLLKEGGYISGVRLADGTTIRANRVLSAADGYYTRRVLLGNPDAERIYPKDRLSDQPVQVNLGVADDWADTPGPMTYCLPTPPVVGGRP